MALVVVVLALAALAARLRGGRPSRVRLPSPGLLAAAVLCQALGALVGGAAWALGGAASAVLVLVLLGRARVPGGALVALGLLANALVVGLNGAMPVSLDAAVRAGADVTDVVLGTDRRHEVAGTGTRLRLLGDVVPVPLPLLPQVVSAGDVLVAAGLGRLVLVAAGGRPGGPGRRARERDGTLGPAPRRRPVPGR